MHLLSNHYLINSFNTQIVVSQFNSFMLIKTPLKRNTNHKSNTFKTSISQTFKYKQQISVPKNKISRWSGD